MNVPSHKNLFQPTLDVLRDLGGPADITTIEQAVLERLQLPPEVTSLLHKNSNKTEIRYRLDWARTYLKKAGLIDNPKRGIWQLTELGCNTPTIDADALDEKIRSELREQRQAKGGDEKVDEAEPVVKAEDAGDSDPSLPNLFYQQSTVAQAQRSLTPHLPTYKSARYFLRIVDGVAYDTYRSMYDAIWSQRGTPQETTDWAEPEEWIPERLAGDEQALALRLWRESEQTLNPRYVRGAWYMASKHDLSDQENHRLRITQRGQDFIAQPAGPIEAEIDLLEGILTVLRLVAEKGPGWRGEYLPGFTEFCHTFTTLRSEHAIKGYLHARLSNLIDRGYVMRSGLTYQISDAGLAYLDAHAERLPGPVAPSQRQSDIRKLAKDLRDEARQQLHEYLFAMNPFKFEELIKLLLEEMGYDNVETTSPTNDKGVDVVANIELGISSVREVIQVKRHKGSINRTVLDQLRGSLHRFNAVRGTVITTGKFSKGTQQAAFERGAAPITLIDGEKLLDLLMERQIGVSKKSVDYYEFDPSKLIQFETEGEA